MGGKLLKSRYGLYDLLYSFNRQPPKNMPVKVEAKKLLKNTYIYIYITKNFNEI